MMPVAEVKPGPALYVHGVFVANDPTGLNQARFEEVARKINEATAALEPPDRAVPEEWHESHEKFVADEQFCRGFNSCLDLWTAAVAPRTKEANHG